MPQAPAEKEVKQKAPDHLRRFSAPAISIIIRQWGWTVPSLANCLACGERYVTKWRAKVFPTIL